MTHAKLDEYPRFRKDSLTLAKNIHTMVDEMDALMASNLSDSAKQSALAMTVKEYLP